MISPASIHDHRVHSRRRARERVGLKLSRKAEATIIAAIRRGRAEYVRAKGEDELRERCERLEGENTRLIAFLRNVHDEADETYSDQLVLKHAIHDLLWRDEKPIDYRALCREVLGVLGCPLDDPAVEAVRGKLATALGNAQEASDAQP